MKSTLKAILILSGLASSVTALAVGVEFGRIHLTGTVHSSGCYIQVSESTPRSTGLEHLNAGSDREALELSFTHCRLLQQGHALAEVTISKPSIRRSRATEVRSVASSASPWMQRSANLVLAVSNFASASETVIPFGAPAPSSDAINIETLYR